MEIESKHCTLDYLLDDLNTNYAKCELNNKKPTPYLSLEYKDGTFSE